MATEPQKDEGAAELEGLTPTVNTPLDAPTIFADSIQGVMVSDQVIKIFLLEQVIPVGETEPKGRYIANLIFPTPQLRQIGEAFIKLADQTGH